MVAYAGRLAGLASLIALTANFDERFEEQAFGRFGMEPPNAEKWRRAREKKLRFRHPEGPCSYRATGSKRSKRRNKSSVATAPSPFVEGAE